MASRQEARSCTPPRPISRSSPASAVSRCTSSARKPSTPAAQGRNSCNWFIAHSALRRLAGAMRSASRYLATVRRAHSMPCSLSMPEIWLSDSGFFRFSAATSCRIRARTAVLDALPPVSVPSAEPKKYFSSKVP